MSTNLISENEVKSRSRIFKGSFKTEYYLILILALLFIVFSVTSPVFLTGGNITTLLRQASIYGVVAIGMLYVIISSGIDLSVGSVVGLSGVVVAINLVNGMPVVPAVSISVITGTFVGLVNGILVYDGKVPPFIATMGTMTVVRAVIMLITGAKLISGLPNGFKGVAQLEVLGIPFLFVAYLVVIVVAHFILHKTVFGRNIFAYGSNKEAARLSGINVRMTVYGIYIFSALICSVAGILLSTRLGNGVPTAGEGYELDAIASAVVGGASLDGGEGSVIGTVLGAMIMATLRQGGTLLGINAFILEIIIGSLIVVAVLFDKIRKK